VLLVVSYTTVPPLPDPRQVAAIGGPFLWHYPSARADWTLSSILPYGARTFLSRREAASDCLSNFPICTDKYNQYRAYTQWQRHPPGRRR